VTQQSHTPWRLPALERFGSELRRLEEAEPILDTQRPNQRRRLLSAAGGTLACALAILIALDGGQRAAALSIINRAPALAAKSLSVAFRSVTTIGANGRQLRQFSESGEIDFATSAYRTALEVPGSGLVERRRVGGILYRRYVSQGRVGLRSPQWVAVQLTHSQQAALTPAPGADAFTDPLALLSLLAHTPAVVTLVGDEVIEGMRAKHYRLQTDLASILNESSTYTAEPAGYRDIRATLDVWLDHGGRPLRVAEHLAGISSSGAVTLQAVTTFSNYGQRVQIRAPRGVQPSRTLLSRELSSTSLDPSRVFERSLFSTR
jgi:hypothetical protein